MLNRGTRPVVQSIRTFHPEVEVQITQEVKKLLAAGFIKPIQHPRWLSNIVPVKKKNGQIRCCVDFRNLNKACPKDEFPLPNMDLLIDSAAGHGMFSFMDGFSGYNQIFMSPRDAEKTAFRTPIGNFYYTIMPFGLKNQSEGPCCVDFRNLNKACPKDEFPLPNMDLLIDSAAGHGMFSFMDGFSGYNQIFMSPRDAEKTAFRTPIGNFYYTIMPFGLKNAGATYQRTMTAMFHDMMHREIEDYVDDIVVKSKTREDHFGILKKVFERC
jgi:hypothetical protein